MNIIRGDKVYKVLTQGRALYGRVIGLGPKFATVLWENGIQSRLPVSKLTDGTVRLAP